MLVSRGSATPDERGVISGGQLVPYVFRVEQALKGDIGAEVTVLSAADGAACGLEVPPDRPVGLILDRRGEAWQGSLYQPELLREASGLPPTLPVKRLGGIDRYDTARGIAVDAPGRPAPGDAHAVLASGEAFPDALVANALAGHRAAPVLITPPTKLAATTLSALEETGTSRVTVIGGPGAVADSVLAEPEGAGYRAERVVGADRYATAAAVALGMSPYAVGDLEGKRTAILASSDQPFDGLAAGPLAYGGRFPLLLTTPTTLPVGARQALVELGITQVVLVGRSAAVGPGVEAQLRSLGVSVRRIAGTTRTETALALADVIVGALGRSSIGLVNGDNFADALAAGAHSGRIGAPLLLTATGSDVGWQVTNWLRDRAGRVEGVVVYGGTEAVTEAAVSQVTVAATP